MLPLTTKLGAPQRINCMAEVSVSMSKKVLTEASLDASILSSVIGSYDDHNLLGSASFMYQGSSDYSNSSLHLCNLFNTLLRLMEPSHVSECVIAMRCHMPFVIYLHVCIHITYMHSSLSKFYSNIQNNIVAPLSGY